MKIYIQANTSYNIRTEQHQGRPHIIVPVVMMIEGVHSGSHGPLLHLAEDLGRFPAAWNGIPVVIQHPQSDGENISANEPSVIDSEKVGAVYNTIMDGLRLRAEAWLDVAKMEQVSKEALGAIRNQAPLDVSVGVFTEEETTSGIYNNEEYEAIARNHRPDHLALLPGGSGACSWEDGCGVRVNNEKKKGGTMKDEKSFVEGKDMLEAMKSLSKMGLTVLELEANEQGMRETVSSIQGKLDTMDTVIRMHYLTEVYEDYFVYEIRTNGTGGSGLFKQGYQTNEDESIEFTGESSEVRRKVEYVTMEKQGLRRTNFNNNKKEVKVKTNECPACIKKVDALIANEATKFTADDKEWLSTLEEAVLDKLLPEAKEEVKTEPEVNAKQVIEDYEKSLTPEERLKKLPAETQEQLQRGLKVYKDQRDAMEKVILTQTEEGVWTEESLKDLSMDTLEGIFKTVNKEEEVNFLGLGANNKKVPIETNEELLLPMGIEIETEEKK